MTPIYDVAVVGAGVLGLAHAYQLARRGLRVIVFERHNSAQGASIRNFGMIWPIGQPLGALYQLARRSREIWLEVLQAAGVWHNPCGSLHLAYHDDEAQVLTEFRRAAQGTCHYEILSPTQVTARYPAIRSEGLRAGLWSETELTVDPRQIIAELPNWLQKAYGVEFRFNTTVLQNDLPVIKTSSGEFQAHRCVICTGIDYHELAPESFVKSGLIACKLQMMRTQPFGDSYQLGTMLAAGLTLRHYKSFAECPSLPALTHRLDAELPEYARYGIHVLVSQNAQGEVILGDSHEYGSAIEPFDKPQIDALILSYLHRFLNIPNLQIAARWHGTYVKHPTEAYVVARPASQTLAVTGVGGAGMTLSFGLAEQQVSTFLGATS